MNVLHLIASIDPREGGPIAGIFESAQVWSANGHSRSIVCFDSPDDPWVQAAPVRAIALGSSGLFRNATRRMFPWYRYRYTPRLTRWLDKNYTQYDAIIVNGLWNYVSFGTWRALNRARIPYYVFPHGMLDPYALRARPYKGLIKKAVWGLWERKVVRDAAGVFFTCEEERLLANRSFKPYSAREYVVGYGAPDIGGEPGAQRAAFEKTVPDLGPRKFALFMGRIHEKKGLDLLIRAFARVADVRRDLDIVIAGPDNDGLKAKLQRLADGLGISGRIHWPGMLSRDAKWGAYRNAEFFVLTSHQENFGLVVAEALAAARPVLITNKVNIWREIEADGAGLVVSDDDAEVTEGLSRMAALSEAELSAFGQKARECYLARYNIEKIAVALIDTIATLNANFRGNHACGGG